MEDPVEVRSLLAPVVADDSQVGRHVDEDDRNDQHEAEHQDEHLLRSQPPCTQEPEHR